MPVRVAAINVEGVKRRLMLDEEIWRRAVPEAIMVASSEMVPAYVEMAVPKGKTGNLQKSATIKVEPFKMSLWFTALYALYVDEGFPASEGRYIPEPLEKRLTSSESHARKRAFEAARLSGYTKKHAAAAYTTKIKQVDWTEMGGPYSGRFVTEVGGRKLKHPHIRIDKDATPLQKEATMRHELAHAIQHAAERPFSEKEAYTFEAAARRGIGTHPGYKGAHFSEEIANMLKEDLKSIIEVVINRIWVRG